MLLDNGIALEIDAPLCDLLCSETLYLAVLDKHCPGEDTDRGMVIVAELLELLLKIVATFPSPLTLQQRKMLHRVILPMHTSSGLPCFLKEIIPIVLHLLQKSERRPGSILEYLTEWHGSGHDSVLALSAPFVRDARYFDPCVQVDGHNGCTRRDDPHNRAR